MNKRDKEIHETIKTIGTFNQRSVNMILFSMLLGLLEDG